MQPRTSTLAAFRSPAHRGRRSRTFTVAQAAALLGITRSATFRLIRKGAIPARRRAGRIEVSRAVLTYLVEVPS